MTNEVVFPFDSFIFLISAGICNDGRCACNAGYQGFMCADGKDCIIYTRTIITITTSTCVPAICEPRCSNGGECVFPNDCRCSTGWLGDTCSIRNVQDGHLKTILLPYKYSTAICTHNCSGRGTCVGPETCTDCAEGWTGDSCAEGDYFLILLFIKL